MSGNCLFCGLPEKGYKPSKSADFICSRCVQLLLSADQGHLKRAYEKAVRLGYAGKASAIKTFLIAEDDNAEAEKLERDLVRERAVQSFRPARDQVRAQPSAWRLDSGRLGICRKVGAKVFL
jgi:hypothetical protein